MCCPFCGNTGSQPRETGPAKDHGSSRWHYTCQACGARSVIIDPMPTSALILLCLTMGLLPYVPEPHLWEKLKMLAAGELVHMIDVFDLVLHAAPWVLLMLKLIISRLSLN